MAAEDDILDQLKILNRNFANYVGGRPWGGGTSTTNVGATKTTQGASKSLEGLRKVADGLHSSMRMLHGSTDEFRYGIEGLLRVTAVGGALAGVFGYLVHSATNVVATYNKLSDVGQMFRGSLMEMQQYAADAGLSLEEYSQLVQKHSTLAAVMNVQQQATGQSLNDLQKNVRAALKPMGFYGMSLTEVTDTTLEMADNFRMAGWLYRTETGKQTKAAATYVQELSMLATATGKSRQKIMEDANRAMRETGALTTLAYTGVQGSTEALTKWTASLSSMGELGSQFATMLGGSLTTSSAYLTEQGQAMVNLGLTNAVGMVDGLAQKIQSGYVPSIEENANFMEDLTTELERNVQNLRGFAAAGNAEATRMLAWIGQLRKIDWREAARKQQEAKEALEKNPYSEMALTFESTFHELTGSFRLGLYSALIKAFVPNPNDKEQYQTFFKNLKETLGQLGSAFGTLLAAVAKMLPLLEGAANVIAWVFDKFIGLRDWLTRQGVGEGWATGITAGIAFALWKAFKAIKTIFVTAGRVMVFGAGGSLGGMLENFGGGIGRRGRGLMRRLWPGRATKGLPLFDAAEAARGNIFSRMGRGMMTMFKGMGGLARGGAGLMRRIGSLLLRGALGGLRFLGKGLIGAVIGWLADSLLGMLPQFRGRDSIRAAISGAGYGSFIGGLLAGPFAPVGMVIGGIIGAIGGVILENLSGIKDAIPRIISEAWGDITWLGQAIIDGIKNIFSSAAEYVKDALSALRNLLPSNWFCGPTAATAPVPPVQPNTPPGAAPPALANMQQNINDNQAQQAQQLQDQANAASNNSNTIWSEIRDHLSKMKGYMEQQAALMQMNNDSTDDMKRHLASNLMLGLSAVP